MIMSSLPFPAGPPLDITTPLWRCLFWTPEQFNLQNRSMILESVCAAFPEDILATTRSVHVVK